ncbi:DEAD/DEAH box helicase family protein [Streptomyces sp. N2-109]|uniref:DEAD/DEAH box helicase family protein n=1 Tax=Streptomyces gossypii TaxID=2883101 RepID=A0ABT2JSL7_9ACTN|nr:DEAD/DEAH box helicase family protein [Streptomyces gossypii]MCT2590879.1 DEAD/DEAH box helicase family protein [Streptomyces gossypii]
MSPIHHHEHAFEDGVVASLLASGWRQGEASHYNSELALDTARLFEFIGATQGDAWNELLAKYGVTGNDDPSHVQREFAKRLAKEIDDRGALDVIRNGVKDRGVRIRLAYFRPTHTLSGADALTEYNANQLTVTRQLPYAAKKADAGNTLDLTLFLNGIPVATAELKNPLTQQTVEDAKRQYRSSRDPLEPIFARRALVHFAVDPDLVFLTTKLKGKETHFLPFNTGSEGPGNSGGAGNPASADGYRSAYLWEQIWHPDTWMDLLQRFLHVHTAKDDRGRITHTLIFPRFHQWHAVRELTAHAAQHGSGQHYLVMHSAGSGKSNTIAWLAHRLQSLFTTANDHVFDKVIVITDRSVLDTQLQETVGKFEQTEGVVRKIDGSGSSKSQQVADALTGETAKIIIVTLQTFPYVLEHLASHREALSRHKFAVIVDEAHSSQSGESSTDLKRVLRGLGAKEDVDFDNSDDAKDDWLTASAKARGRHANLSYFAFTATPKPKTLELFGTPDKATGNPRAFHIYSMRQAIDEGFILDTLRNYVTYKTYWKLANSGPDDPEVDAAKANSALARFVYLHESTLSQHAEVIVEHFRHHTLRRLGGRAKAMVVTRSRESAVRLHRSINKYVADHGYPELNALVAFSGPLKIDDEEVTEAGINGFSERELPKRFANVPKDAKGKERELPEHRILVVAEKYQTGFDQPLLTTMYVEKPLKGVAAVQTLSRLNRTHPRKSQDDIFVLDFANEAENIQAEFKPFYEEALTTPTDPNLLYTAQRAVMEHRILVDSEMEAFADAYAEAQRSAGGNQAQGEKLHAALYRHTDPARDRFAALLDSDDEDEAARAEEFRSALRDFVRKYGFLAQIVPYADPELERLYLFGKHLQNRLPRRQDGSMDIEVDLTHLHTRKTGETDVSLSPEGEQVLPGFADGAGGAGKEADEKLLSEILAQLNDKFGEGLTDEHRLLAEQHMEAARADTAVQQAALANTEEAFGHVFDKRYENEVVDHASTSSSFVEKFYGHDDLRSAITREARRAAYRLIRRDHGVADAA